MTLDVIGWLLGRRCPATSVEIVAAGGVLQRAPVNVRRPDVAAYYPEAADGERSGFQTVVNGAVAAENELLLQAVLLDESRVPIGAVRVRTESADTVVPATSTRHTCP